MNASVSKDSGATTDGREASGSSARARSRSLAQVPGDPARATIWIRPARSSPAMSRGGMADASSSSTGSAPAATAAAISDEANATPAPWLRLTTAMRTLPSVRASCAAAVPSSLTLGARRSAPGSDSAALSGETSHKPAGRSTSSARLLQASS